jgi:hypothetical protein
MYIFLDCNLNHHIFPSAASTDIPVGSAAGSNVPDNSTTTINLNGDSNVARPQQLQHGPFHLQADIIETGVYTFRRCGSVGVVIILIEVFWLVNRY